MPDNDSIYIAYTYYIPSEVAIEARKKFYDEIGNPLYAVQVDENAQKYLRHDVRLITDPEYYRRPAYILYDAKAIDAGDLEIAGYLVDRLDLIRPERIIDLNFS